MDIGGAISLLKAGGKVTRLRWTPNWDRTSLTKIPIPHITLQTATLFYQSGIPGEDKIPTTFVMTTSDMLADDWVEVK